MVLERNTALMRDADADSDTDWEYVRNKAWKYMQEVDVENYSHRSIDYHTEVLMRVDLFL